MFCVGQTKTTYNCIYTHHQSFSVATIPVPTTNKKVLSVDTLQYHNITKVVIVKYATIHAYVYTSLLTTASLV